MKRSGWMMLIATGLLLGFAAPAMADNGTCPAGATLISTDCQDVQYTGCCKGSVLVWCESDGSALCYGDCATLSDPASQTCGWLDASQSGSDSGYFCGGSGADPSGTSPLACDFTCTPNCTGRVCGPDGCGGTCGAACPATEYCDTTGHCAACSCDGIVCGGDQCSTPCGTCTDNLGCDAGQCVTPPAGCAVTATPGCGGCDCESSVCDASVMPECCQSGAGGWTDSCVAACAYFGEACPCLPDCTGKVCGDDGCGGTCGSCTGAKQVCDPDNGQCCVPDCTGKICGDNGCGGQCSACSATQYCTTGNTCAACSCGDQTCGTDQCGNSCSAATDGSCPTGAYCDKLNHCQECTCVGKQCGDDGCGNPCGTCTGGKGCSDAGTCVAVPAGCVAVTGQKGCPGCACETCVCNEDAGCCSTAWDSTCAGECASDCGAVCPCVPQCTGLACGDDGCGGTCGLCGDGQVCDTGVCKGYPTDCLGTTTPSSTKCVVATSYDGCCDSKGRMVWCQGGQLFCADCPAQTDPTLQSCGWSTNSDYECGGAGAGPDPNFPLACGAVCIPECTGKVCGDDGCGRTCGSCKAGTTVCTAGQCVACTADCTGKECGDDGCGGTCGSPCAAGLVCGDHRCVTPCYPDCVNKACGDDGCGGTCGACEKGWQCANGACAQICTPACDGKQCGPDGCGGVCAVCAAGQTCSTAAQCVATCTPSCTGKQCGSDGCGGSCGVCGTGATCQTGVCVAPAPDGPVVLDVPAAGTREVATGETGTTAGGYDKGTFPTGATTTGGGGCTAVPGAASVPWALLLSFAGALLPRRRR